MSEMRFENYAQKMSTSSTRTHVEIQVRAHFTCKTLFASLQIRLIMRSLFDSPCSRSALYFAVFFFFVGFKMHVCIALVVCMRRGSCFFLSVRLLGVMYAVARACVDLPRGRITLLLSLFIRCGSKVMDVNSLSLPCARISHVK